MQFSMISSPCLDFRKLLANSILPTPPCSCTLCLTSRHVFLMGRLLYLEIQHDRSLFTLTSAIEGELKHHITLYIYPILPKLAGLVTSTLTVCILSLISTAPFKLKDSPAQGKSAAQQVPLAFPFAIRHSIYEMLFPIIERTAF